MKIGILGGSFDPIHNGHLHMAVCARNAFALDEVWMIPAGHSPNKDEHAMTPALDRLNMCRLAAEQYPWLKVNPMEIESAERSYTYRTLEKLTREFPDHTFYLIMGGDSLDYFEDWKHPEIIASLCTILVIPRDEFDQACMLDKINSLEKLFACSIRIVPCRKYPISSTQVRASLQNREYGQMDLPMEVLDYIKKNHLYGVS